MTPEERLAKIEEKHQALAETVEVLAGMQKVTEARMESLAATVERMGVLTIQFVGKTQDIIDHIGAQMQNHEYRIDRLEGN